MTRRSDLFALPSRLGRFDTVLILRNNVGLGGLHDGRSRLLEALWARTGARGRIITDSVDPARLEPSRRPSRNHRYRTRWLLYASPWFRYAMCSPRDARELVTGSDWRVARVLDDGSPRWVAILEKPASGPSTRRGRPGAS